MRPVGLAPLALVLFAHGATPLDSIDFRAPGASEELIDALRGASVLLSTQAEGAAEAQDYFAAARSEYARLLAALYAEGYYSGVIHVAIDGREAASIPPLDAPAAIGVITVIVEPGPRFAFSRAEIVPLAPGTTLPPRFAVGRIARSGIMQEAVGVAIDEWRSAGRAKAAPATQSIVADHATAQLDARFAINPGPIVRFGTLSFSGSRNVRPRRLQEIAGFPVGDVYSPADVEKVAARLRRTGAFKSVSVTEAERLGAGDTLDLEAALVEQLPRRLGFGAEIASLDGVSLSAYWLHRNLLGGAESLRFDAAITGIGGTAGGADFKLGARFNRPATFSPDNTLFIEAVIEHEDERDFTADRGSIEIGLERVFTDKWSGEVGVTFGYERVTDDLGTSNFATVSLPVTATRDGRDDPLNARRGTYLMGNITPFVGFEDAGTGARLAFDGRVYRSFAEEGGIVLAARVQGGAVVGSDTLETPRDFLFYSGGGGTVRGQPYQSLGTTVDCSSVGGPGCLVQTGGRSFLGLSAEIRAPLRRKLGIVGFADAGFIGTDFLQDGEWHSGAGIGLRYDTGIGPIRFDVAAPIGGNTGDGVQFYVGIGQAF